MKSVSHALLFGLYVVIFFSLLVQPSRAQTTRSTPVDWKTIYHVLFSWNIEKNHKLSHLLESNLEKQVEFMRERSIYYNAEDFNISYSQIMTKAPPPGQRASEAQYQERANKLSYEANSTQLKKFQDKNIFSQLTGVSRLQSSPAAALLEKLFSEQKDRSNLDKNYFETSLGQAITQNYLKDVLIVVVPGFGSHTIKDYTYPELVREANAYYGRPKDRQVDIKGTNEFEECGKTPVKFYTPKSGIEIGLDVVHPSGYELGNSMGKDADSAFCLKKWVEGLPPAYANKKLVFLGYSKGAPITHALVALHPSIRQRTLALITIAGATQGSIAAQDGINKLVKVEQELHPNDNIETPEQAKQKIISKAENGSAALSGIVEKLLGLSPYEYNLATSFLKALAGPAAAEMGLMGIDSQDTARLNTAFDGVVALTNYERIKWNLINLNDSNFDQPLAVMNLSAITDKKDLLLPCPVSPLKELCPPTIIPQPLPQGGIEHTLFSRDNFFLYITSRLGFSSAAGGMFDTQVAWLDTKSMDLDRRPISQSLTEKQIKLLARELKEALPAEKIESLMMELRNWGKTSLEDLGSIPRFKVLRALQNPQNLDFIDLGDLRGTHWDSAFEQVYRPDPKVSSQFYVHTFPRKAFLTALVETLALYQLSRQGGGAQ